MNGRALALSLLSFLGLVDTLYLGIKRGTPVQCTITTGCEEVLNSRFSTLAGVPISWFGFAFYLTVFSLAIFSAFGEDRALRATFWLALPAFLVSLGLVGIQAFVLHAYCQYCLGSAILATLILLFSPNRGAAGGNSPLPKSPGFQRSGYWHSNRLSEGRLMELLMSRIPESSPSPEAVEIEILVRRTLAGDPAAFGEIVRRHERRVMTLSLRLLGSVADAQDAAQEVFLRAFKYIHRFDSRKPIEPWLTQMTVNVCRDIGRQRQRRYHTFPAFAPGEANEARDESSDPFADLASGQQKELLRQALDGLPEKERMALILREVEGMSTTEVAEILRSTEGTVRSQICRGRLRLKEAIDRITGVHS